MTASYSSARHCLELSRAEIIVEARRVGVFLRRSASPSDLRLVVDLHRGLHGGHKGEVMFALCPDRSSKLLSGRWASSSPFCAELPLPPLRVLLAFLSNT